MNTSAIALHRNKRQKPGQRHAALLVVAWLGLSPTQLTHAQSDPVPDGNMDADRVAPRQEASGELTLPEPMPAVRPFDSLVGFQVEHSRGRSYAIDPKSIHLWEKTAMMTVSVKAPGGAVNTGYYAIDCDTQKYRMMAYESGGQWKVVKRGGRWRDILDLKKRRHQFVALFGASCELGGFRVESPRDLVRRLHETVAEDQ